MVSSEKPGARVGVLVVPFPHMHVDSICNVAFMPLKKKTLFIYFEANMSIIDRFLAATKTGVLVSGLLMILIGKQK